MIPVNQMSSALSQLYIILKSVADYEDGNQPTASVILDIMGLSKVPENLVRFYSILKDAEEEARRIRGSDDINGYINVIRELHNFSIINHLWRVPVKLFGGHIINKGVLNTLHALSIFFYQQNPQLSLDDELIEYLSSQFKDLLDEVDNSRLSPQLKTYLCDSLEELIQSLEDYSTYGFGTDRLLKVAGSSIAGLIVLEPQLKKEDKENGLVGKVTGFLLFISTFLTPNIYDFIGAAPNVANYWIPSVEKFEQCQKLIGGSLDSNIQCIVESFISSKQKELPPASVNKALPPSE